MKKVMIIYKFLPEYRVDFYQQLRNKLLACGIELYLVYGKFNKTDALRKNEVEIDWAQYLPNRRFYVGRKELLWQPCLKYLKDKDLIIVQPENGLLLNYYLMFSRYFSRYKLAFWGHVNNMQDDPKSAGNRFKRFFITKCDRWFGYTKSANDFLIQNNYPPNKITVVQNAIDTVALRRYYAQIAPEEVSAVKSRLGITGRNIGIYCGGMYPDKDFDFILQTCLRVKKNVPDFHMLFIGSGIEASKITEAARGRDWIHYIGPKFGKERVVYFKISALQIMPRLVGLCILDSFAMETPIITTENPFHGPEIDYLENGINGIMTKDNLDEYSEKIIELLKTKKYLQLIEGGKLSAEKYSIHNMTENFKNGILASLPGTLPYFNMIRYKLYKF